MIKKVLSLLTLVACASPPPQVRQEQPSSRIEVIAGDAERGRELYEKDCAVCHGVDGNGAGISYGFEDKWLHIQILPLGIYHDAEHIRTIIRDGYSAEAYKDDDPDFRFPIPLMFNPAYAPTDEDAVIAYVQFLVQARRDKE